MNHIINGRKFITLFYDPDINRFIDGLGRVVNDIFRIITPNQAMVFKERKDMLLVKDRSGENKVTLIYLEESKDLSY